MNVPMLPDGYTDLPAGKIAALVTFLERDLAAPVSPIALPAGARFERLGGADTARYRALFRAVGQDWLWFSRLTLPDHELAAKIGPSDVFTLALTRDGEDIGLLELDFRERPKGYLAFFGVVPGMVGAGLGRAMMAEGLMRAQAAGCTVMHVNTCTLDHPKALEFYIRAGFIAKKRAIEVFDDPRVAGLMPRDVARHIPIIDG